MIIATRVANNTILSPVWYAARGLFIADSPPRRHPEDVRLSSTREQKARPESKGKRTEVFAQRGPLSRAVSRTFVRVTLECLLLRDECLLR